MRDLIPVGFVLAHENAKLPFYASELAVGADIYAVEDFVLSPNPQWLDGVKATMVRTGLVLASMPEDFEIQIRSRSGLASKGVIVVNAFGTETVGTVDPDYRNEVKVLMASLWSEYSFKAGDRIAQMVVQPRWRASFSATTAIDETKRGQGGFGSTGA